MKDKSTVINIKPNNNTLCSEIKCNQRVNFKPEDSIGQLLGFKEHFLEANKVHVSDLPVSILRVNVLRFECSLQLEHT